MKEKTLSVSAIQRGTVIDHIALGKAFPIVRLLRLCEEGHPVTIGLNLKSGSKGLKDLIKIENIFLTSEQRACISIFSPQATVNVIENYKVIQKFPVSLPSTIEGLLICPNSRCITRHEPIPTRLFVEENGAHVQLRCRHCEKLFSRDELYPFHLNGTQKD